MFLANRDANVQGKAPVLSEGDGEPETYSAQDIFTK